MFEDGFKLGIEGIVHKILRPFRIFNESVEKVFYWFPVIWNDRDWDQNYLYTVLKHKLNAMSVYQHKYGNSVDAEKYSVELAEARDLCNKLLNYDYDEESMKLFYDKYPNFEIKHWSEPCGNGLYSWETNLNDEQNQTLLECSKKEDELFQADKQKLFQFISDHIDGWWD